MSDTATPVAAETAERERCDRCGPECVCLTPEQVAAYITGGDNARWLRRS